jgi:hypothetical protein
VHVEAITLRPVRGALTAVAEGQAAVVDGLPETLDQDSTDENV